MPSTIALQLCVSHYRHLTFDLGCSFTSELNVLLFGEQIPTRLDFLGTAAKAASRTVLETVQKIAIVWPRAPPDS